MAIVRKLEKIVLERGSKHTEVNCTYTIIADDNGEKYLQLDTYGSNQRQIQGKKSQSLRLSEEAIDQLKTIIQQYF